MPIQPTEKIWHNGKWISWDDAKIHVLAHVVSYGSAVFEGIRCYETTQGPAIFRLREHMQRLVNSARIYRMELPFSVDEFSNTACELVRINKMNSCYVKPIVLRGYGDVGVNPLKSPIDVYIACWYWGAYLGPEAVSKGVDVCVSSWTRIAPNTLPAMSKAAANYMNSQLVNMEARMNGFVEGIALDDTGHVSEGSGENVFIVHDGTLYTPPLATSILPGITRNSVVQLAEDLNIPFKETVIPREMLYIADEVFFAGTAVEITPIRSVDHIQVGKGVAGPITLKLQAEFFALTSGKKPDRHNWLTPVGAPVGAASR
ncbi:MAG TPA: branched-chain amino acid transaminase [Candidatus Acidoferrum sp.]|nr:branched-chain amino acid transaminase [Candidatus Acidoferrum sp.]